MCVCAACEAGGAVSQSRSIVGRSARAVHLARHTSIEKQNNELQASSRKPRRRPLLEPKWGRHRSMSHPISSPTMPPSSIHAIQGVVDSIQQTNGGNLRPPRSCAIFSSERSRNEDVEASWAAERSFVCFRRFRCCKSKRSPPRC